MPASLPLPVTSSPTSAWVEHLRQDFGWGAHTRVVVGFSAGPDSTALAAWLQEAGKADLRLDLHLAWVDHGWATPLETERRWRHAQSVAVALGLPISRERGPASPPSRAEGPARRHRYERLLARARALGARWIALGHHAGDQAETMLLRRARGAGAVGAAGMPSQRPVFGSEVHLARPCLAFTAEQLHAPLASLACEPFLDPANEHVRYDRARLRTQLTARPRARLDLFATRMASRATLRQARLAARTQVLRDGPLREMRTHATSHAVSASRAELAALSDLDLHLALRMLGAPLHADRHGPWLTARHRSLVTRVLAEGGAVDLPSDLRFHAGGKNAWLARRSFRLGETPLLRRRTLKVDGPPSYPASHEPHALLDAEVLGPTSLVRQLREGDAFHPFGQAGHQATDIARWLRKQGVPACARRGVYVVEGIRGIAWVVGHRIDARHALGPNSRRAARLRVTGY